jgi:hypothetical protein
MSKKYIDNLNKIFEASGAPSQEKLMNLMDESMEFFREIKSKMESDDPEKREEALKETLEIKWILESKMQSLSEKTGLNMNQLAALAENTSRMSPEERSAIESAKAKFQAIQDSEFIKNKV